MVKWIARDITDIFKGLSLHRKLKEMKIIWLFTTQPLLPFVSAFNAVAQMNSFASNTTQLLVKKSYYF